MKNIYLIIVIIILTTVLILIPVKEIQKVEIEDIITIKLNNEDIELEEYVIGVVAAEMPASFEVEALKAQAIASRTYAYKKYLDNINMTGTINDQAYINKEEMQTKWNQDYELYYNKIKQAVEETKNEIITYNNEPIIAYYFSMSNGATENSESVFNEIHPYLQSVESNWETTHDSFEETITYTEEEICILIEQNCNNIILSEKKYSSNNRLVSIKLNDKIYLGTEFRHLLNLRSTDIEIIEEDNQITFVTTGYGHGVGMSQYGANGLAKEDKSYEEILKYYYQDIEIKKIEV